MKLVLASLALLFLPAPILAKVGGRCSSNYDAQCICLDSNTCLNKYGGVAYSGSPGRYPCPSDPNNVVGCIIRPCPRQGSNTQCLFKDACRSPSGGEWLLSFQLGLFTGGLVERDPMLISI